MNELNFTRKNMRYLGQIESHKYNDVFNETKANINNKVDFYNNTMEGKVEDLISEYERYTANKRKLYHLINKKNALLSDYGRRVKN